MKVLKFGGSSLKDASSMLLVGKIVGADPEPKVVVVSAVQGITDSIVTFVSEPKKDEEVQHFIEKLRDTHISILGGISKDMETKQQAITRLIERLAKLEKVLYGISYLEELTPRTMDLVQSFGERLSVILTAAMLQDLGVNAVPVDADELGLITEGTYGNATADLKETKRNIQPKIRVMFERQETPVVTGFFGKTPQGHVAVFGRNGSDYSASVIANAIDARVLEIWKDVDGFMSVDPKIVKEAVTIENLSYDEAAELSYFGAKVLHPRTVEPAREKSIVIKVKNVFEPEKEGTVIEPSGVEMGGTIKSISCMKNLAIVKAYGAGAGYKTGVMYEISQRLSDAGVNIYSAATSQTCVALLIEKKYLATAKKVLADLKKGVIDRIETVDDIALLCVVGEGLGYRKGIAARVFTAVSKEGVSVGMISAGASMVACHFTVDSKDLERTTRAIHSEFFGVKQ
ncbi:MAG: aspartate kinase [Methanomassiliicoccales archaeon]|nr:aspartate kinase [Methanomassiliicoccales archaeon]